MITLYKTLLLIRGFLNHGIKAARKITYHGNQRYCPVCDSFSRRFKATGIELRNDAQCPHCGSLERHRFLWCFLKRRTELFDGKSKSMLHIAPEPCLEAPLKDRIRNYLTADLFNPRAMVKMDICDIHYPDKSFDIIYCSHVLEHVPDDRRAIRELFRVLSTKGWAIINVPICKEITFEDPKIIDAHERLKMFGKEDHVRAYGRDYTERLKEAGFIVNIINVCDLATNDESTLMGLTKASGEIYFCTK
jgi:SAM-dependent methyltransferase